jgi:thioredoxin 1
MPCQRRPSAGNDASHQSAHGEKILMINRRSILFVAATSAMAIIAAPAAQATLATIPFTEAEFERALTSGRPVLVEISAPWCPVCKTQKAILSDLLSEADFKDVVVLEIDFDSQREAVRALGARSQSTLIAFRSGEETGRSVGETRADSIEALLRSAL